MFWRKLAFQKNQFCGLIFVLGIKRKVLTGNRQTKNFFSFNQNKLHKFFFFIYLWYLSQGNFPFRTSLFEFVLRLLLLKKFDKKQQHINLFFCSRSEKELSSWLKKWKSLKCDLFLFFFELSRRCRKLLFARNCLFVFS